MKGNEKETKRNESIENKRKCGQNEKNEMTGKILKLKSDLPSLFESLF